MSDHLSLPKIAQGYQREKDTIGRSVDTVLRLTQPGQPDWFAKIAPLDDCQTVREEAARLDWLSKSNYPAPKIVDLLEHNEKLWLITHAIAGTDAARSAASPQVKITALAEGLRRLHALAPTGCPFDESLPVKLAKAQERVENNLVDGSDFDDQNIGKNPRDLLQDLTANCPAEGPLVVTHGDASMPNFILNQGKFGGVVDCARLGRADRYQDLSLIAWSIGHNLGQRWIPVFLTVYGLPDPDPLKMAYYKSLDEFF